MTNNSNTPIIEHALAPNVRVFFSQRGDVVDGDSYSTFNACSYTGDNPILVAECRKKWCQHLSIEPSHLLIPRQTHSLNVKIIESLPIGEESLQDIDALVTSMPEVALAINTADCVPVMLADEKAGVIAAIHSGWKGTAGRISALAVEKMRSLGASPLRTKAFIGVSICPECFEVGDEVVERFRQEFPHSPEIILERQPRCHIDLQQACRVTLLDCGIPAENIILSGICSRCNPRLYFSARRLGINSGRTLTAILRR